MSKDFVLAHMSDLHAGYRTGNTSTVDGINYREQDGYDALDEMVSQIVDDNIDAALICGDVFHTPNSTPRSIWTVQQQLLRLHKANIPVYILAGNHDQNDIKADLAGSRLLHDPERKIFSHIEPYVKYEISDQIILHMISHHMYTDQESTMGSVEPKDGFLNIFSTHGSIMDPTTKLRLSTNQSPREIVIPDFILSENKWDSVLLGHIHERQHIKNDEGNNIYYNGSLIRRGFSDGVSKEGRGYTRWTVKPDGTFTPEYKTVRQRAQKDFETVDAKGLSASDVFDIIAERLRGTHYGKDGNVKEYDHLPQFYLEHAPILRQKVVNVNAGILAGLDRKTLNELASHAVHWDLATVGETVREIKEETNENGTVLQDYDGADSPEEVMSEYRNVADVVKSFDVWKDRVGYKILEKYPEDQRDNISERSRILLEGAQEKVSAEGS